jgi:hypothetical protein
MFILLLISVAVYFLTQQPSSKIDRHDQTGGDYTPKGWVALHGFDSGLGLSNTDYVDLQNALSKYLSAKHPEANSFFAEVDPRGSGYSEDGTTYYYSSFGVWVDQKDLYDVAVMHSKPIRNSKSWVIITKDGVVERDGINYSDFKLLMAQGLVYDSVEDLMDKIKTELSPSKSVLVKSAGKEAADYNNLSYIYFTILVDDSKSYTGTINIERSSTPSKLPIKVIFKDANNQEISTTLRSPYQIFDLYND